MEAEKSLRSVLLKKGRRAIRQPYHIKLRDGLSFNACRVSQATDQQRQHHEKPQILQAITQQLGQGEQ